MPPDKLRTGAILLAAGSSRRMNGTPKQLLEINGVSLLRRAAQSALEANFSGVYVVLGANAERLRKEVADLPVEIAVNDAWAEGISSSIKTGLAAVRDNDFDAVLIMLCDQPLVTAKILRDLRAAFAESDCSLAACRYADTIGVPALFAREFFGELMNLQRDEGAKKIIKNHLARTALIDAQNAAFDIDTPTDFEKLERFLTK